MTPSPEVQTDAEGRYQRKKGRSMGGLSTTSAMGFQPSPGVLAHICSEQASSECQEVQIPITEKGSRSPDHDEVSWENQMAVDGPEEPLQVISSESMHFR
jgi:hypothetical protein